MVEQHSQPCRSFERQTADQLCFNTRSCEGQTNHEYGYLYVLYVPGHIAVAQLCVVHEHERRGVVDLSNSSHVSLYTLNTQTCHATLLESPGRNLQLFHVKESAEILVLAAAL